MSGLLGGLGGDAGLLAAAAAAVFLLYTAATMAAAAKRKKRAATPTPEISQMKSSISTDEINIQDLLWSGRIFSFIYKSKSIYFDGFFTINYNTKSYISQEIMLDVGQLHGKYFRHD